MQIFCDFDGTISVVDTTDHVLGRLAAPQWQELEAEWLAGRIDAASCMRGQIALIAGDQTQLDAVLDEVQLDQGFADFATWCGRNAVPLLILSDGVDYFIERILTRHGLGHLPIVANRLAGAAGARRLAQPHGREGCAAGSGVCKCEAAALRSRTGQQLIYIGDGRSDFCVSQRADILFAKVKLADYAEARGQGHHRFETFHDVQAVLAPLVQASRAAQQGVR